MNSSTSSSDLNAFSCRIVLYGFLFLSVLVAACFFLPSKHARETMLGSQITKLKALEALPGERVVIVGGSGSGQGFVTSNICAALNRPAYNMGLHAGLGLIYQMAAVEPLIRKGDVVLLIPEYANFDGDSCFGDEELLMMVCDIIPEHKKLLSKCHWFHLLPSAVKYGADKLRHYVSPPVAKGPPLGFDAYGDRIYRESISSWASTPFPPVKAMKWEDFSPRVLDYIKRFAAAVCSKGARCLVFPPAYQQSSYCMQEDYIAHVSQAMESLSTPFAALPERYALDCRYFYDTPYHLNLEGRKYRTELLLEDVRRLVSF